MCRPPVEKFNKNIVDEFRANGGKVTGPFIQAEFRWFTETPQDRMAATIDRTVQLAESGALRVPEGQPIPVEKFSEAVYLAEAPAHGGKPLLVFEP